MFDQLCGGRRGRGAAALLLPGGPSVLSEDPHSGGRLSGQALSATEEILESILWVAAH